MKICEKNRKAIAWLALDALEAKEAAALRAHLADCDGCRKYFDEVSGTAKKLEAAAPEADVQAPAHFHRQLMGRLQAEQPVSAWDELLAALNWRVAVPAMMVLLLAILLVLAQRPGPTTASVNPPTVPVAVAAATVVNDPAPTAVNYQLAAAQSLTKLDELLTREGNESLPPAPVYTASTRLPDNAF